MSESSNTTAVSTARDDSSTSSASSSSSSSSVGSDGKDDKIGSTKPPLPPGQKKEESVIMELATNFKSILKWCVNWGDDPKDSKNEKEERDDLVEERQDTGYTLKVEGNSRKRRRLTPPGEDDELPRVNGGIQKSKLHVSGTTAKVEPSRSETAAPRYTSEQPNSVATTKGASVLENGTAEPVSLIEFTESKWKEQSQTPSLEPLRIIPAPSGKDQLARSLARRNKATQQPKSVSSIAHYRESLLGSSRISKRSATPMSMSVRSRRQTSTPHRSVIGSTPNRWMEPSQYSPPSAPLNTSFRSSVGSENKVDGFENYTQMVERQKIIDEQIKRMRTIAKPPAEVLRKISDGTLRELQGFLNDKNQLKEARRVGRDPVTPRNLKTLNGSQWLNDEVINSYIHLVKERENRDGSQKMITMNSAFVSSFKESGYGRVARWAKRAGAAGEEILGLKGIIIPIHRNFHWTLAFVNVEKKRFEYYDSLAGNWDPISLLRTWMKHEVGSKYIDGEWEDFYPGSQTPQQGNGYDCGVFLCKTAEVIARGGVLNFSQKDIPVIRKMMQVELLKGDLAAL
ncbi:Smt3-specific protease [Orbilia oligospora]|nr:Smt3-specific protease [Orbilia oligospora]